MAPGQNPIVPINKRQGLKTSFSIIGKVQSVATPTMIHLQVLELFPEGGKCSGCNGGYLLVYNVSSSEKEKVPVCRELCITAMVFKSTLGQRQVIDIVWIGLLFRSYDFRQWKSKCCKQCGLC